ATANRGISQREIRIDLDGTSKVFDCGVEMFPLDGVVDEFSQAVASAQVFFRRSRVSCLAGQFDLFVRTQLEPQSFDNTEHNRILNPDNVAGIGIDSFAPEDLAGADVE